jgi:adenylyltransferase/sulfurtransferase
MDDQQLLRYSRQIMLPQFGYEGQQTLLNAHVAVIGAGGLGSPVALYLAAAGVGRLTIADHDVVDLSNLQRQILHDSRDLGRPKVESARDRLQALNPDVSIVPLQARIDPQQLQALVRQVDVVVDASDNFATRFAVNAACVDSGTPLVSGAAIRLEGQLSVFEPARADSPCYRCLYREGDEPDQTCTDNGVLAPVVGVIGSLQALESIKLLTGIGETLCGRLLVFDGLHHEWRSVKLRKDPLCPVCSAQPASDAATPQTTLDSV